MKSFQIITQMKVIKMEMSNPNKRQNLSQIATNKQIRASKVEIQRITNQLELIRSLQLGEETFRGPDT